MLYLLYQKILILSYYYDKKILQKCSNQKIFSYKDDKIINHIYDYYTINCKYGSLNDALFSGKIN